MYSGPDGLGHSLMDSRAAGPLTAAPGPRYPRPSTPPAHRPGSAPWGARLVAQPALVLAEELEMRPLQDHCHLGLGKLSRRTGCNDEARAELATAVAMLREMGMAY